MTTNTEQLLPCPFCGSQAEMIRTKSESLWSHDQVEWTQVRCTNDDCGIETDNRCEGWEPTPAEMWNARAALTQPAQAGEPDAYLHDDGFWTAAKTDAGRQLNDRLLFAGSPKIGVFTTPPASQERTIDAEALIAACVPGGSFCDPQQVADEIRRYLGQWTASQEQAQQPDHLPDAGKMAQQPSGGEVAEQLRKDFQRECDDTDDLLRLMGFDPAQARTEGGSLKLPQLASLIAQRLATKPEPMTDDHVWHSDGIMSANGIAGFKMDALLRIVRAVEAHHGITAQAKKDGAA